jgi:hypothetical protein
LIQLQTQGAKGIRRRIKSDCQTAIAGDELLGAMPARTRDELGNPCRTDCVPFNGFQR